MISIFLKSLTTLEINASIEDLLLTSVGMDTASNPSFCKNLAAFCPSAALRLAITTVAPALARPLAMSKPIPVLPPVTMATLLERSKIPRNR
jgi:hypothetical protein